MSLAISSASPRDMTQLPKQIMHANEATVGTGLYAEIQMSEKSMNIGMSFRIYTANPKPRIFTSNSHLFNARTYVS